MFHHLESRFRALLVSLFILAPTLLLPAIAECRGGAVHVRGYFRKDGTYVQPHMRSASDGNFWNNWSTSGNVNPYTGVPGTRTTPPHGYGQDVYVHGYLRSDGSYVPPHYRSAPDGDRSNNWSTIGNLNPYTGELGTKSDDDLSDDAGISSDADEGDVSDPGGRNVGDEEEGITPDESNDNASGSQTTVSPVAPTVALPPVFSLQAALALSGEDPGPLDGVLGRQTLTALRQYADDNALRGRSLDVVLSSLSDRARQTLPGASVALDTLVSRAKMAARAH